jgi:hypothetical protein
MKEILAAAMAFNGFSEPEGRTDFARLSPEAQGLIVGALMGEYESGPPEMSDSVRTELEGWINAD